MHLHAEVTLDSLLVEMIDFGAVARWPAPEFTCRQTSSYDRGTVAPDQPGWFANSDQNQIIRTETYQGRTEKVMRGADGPGSIVRFWRTTDEKIWADGEKFPSHVGTGTEDYYGYSYAPKAAHQPPFCGEPRVDQAMTQGHNTSTRTRNLDGILRFRANDRPLMAMLDCHADAVQPAKPFVLGVLAPLAGRFKLCAEVAGANAASAGARFFSGLDCVMLEQP